MLLLAFALGMAGQVASTAAMAMKMQPVMGQGITLDHACSGCLGDQDGGIMANCGAVGCWTAPALPAQSTTSEPSEPFAFGVLPEIVIAGIARAPDPHPPRATLHA